MARYAILDKSGQVTNVIVYDGVAPFQLPPGYTLRPAVPADKPPVMPDEEQARIKELVRQEITKQLPK